MEKFQWQNALVVALRALLAGLLALVADTASGAQASGLIAQLHPASLLVGGLLAAPLALRRSVSSSSTPVRRRSAKANRSGSE